MSDTPDDYCPPTLVHFVAKKLGCGMNQVYTTKPKTEERKHERDTLEVKYGDEYREKRARYKETVKQTNMKKPRKEPLKPILKLGKHVRHNDTQYIVSRVVTTVTYHPVEKYYQTYDAADGEPKVRTLEEIHDDCIVRETVEEYPKRYDAIDDSCEISSILAEFEQDSLQ